jgi:NAD(P)H dehydrogenase (quinone)
MPSVKALVVHAHPDPQSFNGAVFGTAVAALRAAGHEVEALDLYAEGFRAAMSSEEREAYEGDEPIRDEQVARHAALVRWADVLVFVYPTWWAGLPAVLKGWLDRVLVTGVAFELDPKTRKVRPALTNVRRIVGITTYGSSRSFSFLVADAGRRTLLRALWMSCRPLTRRTWLGLYGVEAASDDDRRAFLAKVDEKLRSL